MSETIEITKGADRETLYREIAPQIAAIVEGERDQVANLANITAVLKEALGFLWIGFYLEKAGVLVLGPFQGPVACTRIEPGEGVCGHAFSEGKTIIVPNVDEFPGHIVCSSDARSEIVVPLFGVDGQVLGVLDVDSDKIDDFSETDREGLEKIASIAESCLRD